MELDQRTLAAIGAAYLGNDKVLKRLDKKLGPGTGEAIQGVLDGLLGGGSKKKEQ